MSKLANVQSKKGGGIRLEGVPGAKARIEQLRRESPEKLRTGLHDAGIWLKRESQNLTPVATGALRASAKLRVTGPRDRPEVSIEYTMPYATAVHEDLNMFHRNGQAKFLEQPAREYRSTLLHIVEEAFLR